MQMYTFIFDCHFCGLFCFHWHGPNLSLCFGITGVHSVGHRTDLESVWSAVHWCCSWLEFDFVLVVKLSLYLWNVFYNFTLRPWKHPNKQISSVFVSSAGSLLLHLLDWVRLHKADVDEKAREVLQSESPAEHHDYWDVVSAARTYTCVLSYKSYMLSFTKPPYKRSAAFPSSFVFCQTVWNLNCHMLCVWPVQVVSYVLQGRLEEARQMLVKQATLQPAARNMYKLMDTLLSKMPFYNVRKFFYILDSHN